MKPASSYRPCPLYQIIGLLLIPLQVYATMPFPMVIVKAPVTITVHTVGSSNAVKTHASRAARHLTIIKPKLDLSDTPSDVEIETARVFSEPLLPSGAKGSEKDNGKLAAALASYYKSKDTSTLVNYVSISPHSRWTGSLDYNLGVIHYETGFLSLAINDWQNSWDLLKSSKDVRGHALADRALGQLMVLDAELGRTEELKRLFTEIGYRALIGSGSEQVKEARQGYQMMRNNPSVSFKCGPFALDSIRTASVNRHPRSGLIEGAMSTVKGTSLAQVKGWSDQLKMNYQIAKRSSGSAFIVPSVMHWKLGHFAALVRQNNGKYLIQDPTFGTEFWVKADALEAETSGYFLVPSGNLPAGWTPVGTTEASSVWGRGGAKTQDHKETKGCTSCSQGMAVASVFPMLCTLRVQDTPVVYSVPVGPQLNLTIGYNYNEAGQPGNFTFANFGHDWVFQYSSYITVDESQDVTVALKGGGSEIYYYSTFDPINHVFAPDVESQAQLYLTSAGVYERRLPDGSKDVYSQPDGTGRIFLTQIVDPQGNSLILNYDSNVRLSTIQDQLGQQTSFTYLSNSLGNLGFYNIASITEPFGRSAQFAYNPAGELTQITDVIGLRSQFTYDSNNFMDSMTTPYGKTLFYQYTPSSDPTGLAVGLKITLPDGTQSITESWLNHELNTYHWTRKESPFYPDKTKAEITHWLQEANSNDVESGIISYTKRPIDGGPYTNGTVPTPNSTGVAAPMGSIVYNYPGSSQVLPPPTIDPTTGLPIPSVIHYYTGTTNQPSSVSRFLDDGVTPQVTSYIRNTFGAITSSTDPIGRTMNYVYDSNGIDLLQVRQVTNGANDLLAQYTYNAQHEPLTSIDGSGQPTSYFYNAAGQILTRTDAKGGVTTYNYDSNGYLISIDGPLAGNNDKTTFGYDSMGRMTTVTDSEGYTVTTSYDNLDRVTQVTYPDGTYEQTIWNRLDPGLLRDRLGNWTQQQYDSLRQLIQVTDPNGRSIHYQWCTCGALGSITDGAGNVTSWTRDLQGRPTRKTYADTTFQSYSYGVNTGRLVSTTDALQQTKNYSYNTDDTLSQVSYAGAVNPTSTVYYTYDPDYFRITQISNASDTINYTYNNYLTSASATPVTGAGRVQKITHSAIANSDTTYSYDELGRVTNQSINGSANSTSTSYDAMSRITGVTNPLGTFGYTYVDEVAGIDKGTIRLAQMTYPNGQVTNYSYYGTGGDERLQEISNVNGSGTTISQFGYTYDAKGQIVSWKQQADSDPATRFDTAYDPAGELTSAVLKTDATNAVLHQYYYNYDSAANRTSEQVDSSVTKASVNNLNELTGLNAGGATRFQGTISAPGKVTVDGQPASMPTSTNFVSNPSLTNGINNVAVVATDGSGNAQTNNYQVVIPAGGSFAPTYDAAGNMLSNGSGQSYQWDAENRLIQITQGSDTYAFGYDGLGHRITETDDGTLTKQWLWNEDQMAEEKNSGGIVQKRFYPQGEQQQAQVYYYTRDHLGSVREMTGNNQSLVSRLGYDPYGKVTTTTGMNLPTFQYTGSYFHALSSLNLTLNRAYSSNTGRWLTRDTLKDAETSQGPNLYEYVSNNSINKIDPFGLSDCTSLPDSGPGDIQTNILGHNLLGQETGSLTFNFSCPSDKKFLSTWGVTSSSPSSNPVSLHGHVFPKDFTTIKAPSGSGPAYSASIRLTTAASLNYQLMWPFQSFADTIRIVGQCCCKQKPIRRIDP